MNRGTDHDGATGDEPGACLTAGELSLLRLVQDRLLPGDGVMPAASATGAAGAVDRYLAERPELRAEVLDSLVAIRVAAAARQRAGFAALDETERDEVLRDVERRSPASFDALLVQTYTGYYSDAGVQRLLGLVSPLQPSGYPEMMSERFDEGRLDRVRATAKNWRPA